MEPNRHYPNAPITEALIDIQVQYAAPITLEKLREFGETLKGEFPHVTSRNIVEALLTANPDQPAATKFDSKQSTVGYMWLSPDKKDVFQGRLDGFTFSRLKPYQNWQTLRESTRNMWDRFTNGTGVTQVKRIALRYINQLDLPIGPKGLRFEDYLETFPVSGTSKVEDEDIDQFIMRLVLPQKDLNASLVLTEALLPPQIPGHASVILDLDLFRENLNIPAASNDIWDILEEFRIRKNRFFEASITNSARELFE